MLRHFTSSIIGLLLFSTAGRLGLLILILINTFKYEDYFQIFQITSSGQQDVPNSETDGVGQAVIAGEVTCSVPLSPVHPDWTSQPASAHGIKISISNDARAFSQPHLLTLYDDKCQVCQSGGVCQRRVSNELSNMMLNHEPTSISPLTGDKQKALLFHLFQNIVAYTPVIYKMMFF